MPLFVTCATRSICTFTAQFGRTKLRLALRLNQARSTVARNVQQSNACVGVALTSFWPWERSSPFMIQSTKHGVITATAAAAAADDDGDDDDDTAQLFLRQMNFQSPLNIIHVLAFYQVALKPTNMTMTMQMTSGTSRLLCCQLYTLLSLLEHRRISRVVNS